MKRFCQLQPCVRLAWIVFAALLSCVRQHPGPEAGDSVTNWLRACERDRDCGSETMCLNGVCTIPCESAGTNGCRTLHPNGVCAADTSSCDLRCRGWDECRALREGLVCEAGRCRELIASAAPPAVVGGLPEPDAVPEPGSGEAEQFPAIAATQGSGPSEWSGEGGGRNSATFARELATQLTDRCAASPRPGVAWKQDRWLVTWKEPSFPQPGTFQSFELASIRADGNIALTEVADSRTYGSTEAQYFGHDTSIARVAQHGEGTCALWLTDLEAGRSNTPAYFRCASPTMVDVAQIPESDDWLVVWHVATGTPQIALARYSPNQVSWLTGPWPLIPDANAGSLLGITAVNGDAWPWQRQGTPGRIWRIEDVAQPEASDASLFQIIQKVDALSRRELVPLPQGVLVLEVAFETGVYRLRSFTIDPSNGQASAATYIFDGVQGDVSAVALLSQGRVVVCAIDDRELSLLVLDETGLLTRSPYAVEEAGHPATCSLASSGSELMVVWRERETLGPYENREDTYKVFARTVPHSALGL